MCIRTFANYKKTHKHQKTADKHATGKQKIHIQRHSPHLTLTLRKKNRKKACNDHIQLVWQVLTIYSTVKWELTQTEQQQQQLPHHNGSELGRRRRRQRQMKHLHDNITK